jgi:calmodulin
MWRRSKEHTNPSSSEADKSSKAGSAHRLAKTLLRPFSRKSSQGPLVERAASDLHLSTRRSEPKLRLSRSALDNPSSGGVMALRVEMKEVRRVGSVPVQKEIEEVGVPQESSLEKTARGSGITAQQAQKKDVLPAQASIASGPSTPSPASPPATEGLPDELIRELTAAFKYFDHNSDGCIDKHELGAVMRSLGDSPSDAELDAMIAAVDQNGDGSICLGEFLNLNRMAMESGLGVDSDVELREAFNVFDLDKNGFISCEELQQVSALYTSLWFGSSTFWLQDARAAVLWLVHCPVFGCHILHSMLRVLSWCIPGRKCYW